MRKTLYALAIAVMAVCFVAQPAHAQIADALENVTCTGSPSANAVAPTGAEGVGTGFTTVGASHVSVFQVSSSAAATHNWSCLIQCPTRMAAQKGCTVLGFAFYYGIQTTAATSEGAPSCGVITLPVPGASETASTVTPVASTITAQPVVGSANLGTTTAGAFFTQYVSFNTPLALNGPYQVAVCNFSLVQGGAAAMATNSPGGTMFYVEALF